MFYDDYNIDEQYQKLRKILIDTEGDLYKFLGRTKNDTAAVRARKNLKEIEELITPLRKSIQMQRQDNKSEY
jgi:hypothetical protein